MKKVAFLFICLAFACTKEEIGISEIGFGDKITAEYAKNVNLKESISLKVSNIEDSRCPKNVQCPWAGFVNVSLSIANKSASKDIKIEFSTKSSKGEVELNGQKYSIEILEVSPYPEMPSSVDIKNYKVSLVVMKL